MTDLDLYDCHREVTLTLKTDLVFAVDVGALFDEQLDCVHVTLLNSPVQRGHLELKHTLQTGYPQLQHTYAVTNSTPTSHAHKLHAPCLWPRRRPRSAPAGPQFPRAPPDTPRAAGSGPPWCARRG